MSRLSLKQKRVNKILIGKYSLFSPRFIKKTAKTPSVGTAWDLDITPDGTHTNC
jgi:hypothetical protein